MRVLSRIHWRLLLSICRRRLLANPESRRRRLSVACREDVALCHGRRVREGQFTKSCTSIMLNEYKCCTVPIGLCNTVGNWQKCHANRLSYKLMVFQNKGSFGDFRNCHINHLSHYPVSYYLMSYYPICTVIRLKRWHSYENGVSSHPQMWVVGGEMFSRRRTRHMVATWEGAGDLSLTGDVSSNGFWKEVHANSDKGPSARYGHSAVIHERKVKDLSECSCTG